MQEKGEEQCCQLRSKGILKRLHDTRIALKDLTALAAHY